jgi:hypothetical protein
MSEINTKWVRLCAGVQDVDVPDARHEILAQKADIANTTTRERAKALLPGTEPAQFAAKLVSLRDADT